LDDRDKEILMEIDRRIALAKTYMQSDSSMPFKLTQLERIKTLESMKSYIKNRE
jgi:hypothetical protein